MRLIAQISDLHFGRHDPAAVDALAASLSEHRPHLVVISGDLTQRARRLEFIEARTFLDRIAQPKLVVPGNHDVPLYNVVARLLAPLAAYRRHITADLAPMFADTEILVFGINTTRALTIKGGRIRQADVTRLRDALRHAGKAVVKIIVAHHPFEPSAKAGDAVDVLTEAGADVFLTGHLHVSYTGHTAHRYQRGGRSAIAVEAGTATSTRIREAANTFNVLRIAPSRIVVERIAWHATGEFRIVDTQPFVRTGDGWRDGSSVGS
jgi:3',5'-cyclic AMP phosphodiesterase CpdA